MIEPDAAQLARAKRLLAAEGASGSSSESCALAAGRVYDKLDAQLSPLLSAPGFRALFGRGAQLAQGRFPCLAESAVAESATKLRHCLESLEPAAAAETAEALFGTFFALIASFIGERLTMQVLRRAWPTIEGSARTETTT